MDEEEAEIVQEERLRRAYAQAEREEDEAAAEAAANRAARRAEEKAAEEAAKAAEEAAAAAAAAKAKAEADAIQEKAQVAARAAMQAKLRQEGTKLPGAALGATPIDLTDGVAEFERSKQQQEQLKASAEVDDDIVDV